MEPHELHILRRKARRDDDLQSGPVRLYSEVIDLTLLDECRARYTTLAEWLGTTDRTIRRWRDRLVEAGYLRVEEGAPDRLIPVHPENSGIKPEEEDDTDRTDMSGEPDEIVRTSASDRTQASGQPDTAVRSAPDESVRYIRDNNNTQELSSERERAPAPETPPGDGSVGDAPSLDVEDYDDMSDHPAVEVHQDVFPAVRLSVIQREKIAATVDDLDLWRQTLEWWALQDHRARSIARQLRKYQEDHDERSRTSNDRRHSAPQSGGGPGGDGRDGAPADRGGAW
jgi:hypothetical protein